jgi:MFS family permease
LAVALGTTSFVAAVTVSTIVGEDLTGSASLSGLPWAAGVFGTGIGSFTLSQLMARRGRGPGLLLGFLSGAVGAILAIVAIRTRSFVLFVPAALVLGVGNSANHLSRYAPADLYPPDRRASGLSMVVWAGTIGGVAGPALLEPSGRVAMSAGFDRLAGPFLMAIVGCGLATLVVFGLIRRSPHALGAPEPVRTEPALGIRQMWRVPHAQVALIALATAQTVMTLVMAMTPLHMRGHGHSLSAVGFVISVHIFGMYGLSPVSGRLADRFSPVRMVLVGFAVLASGALVAAIAPAHTGLGLAVPLFLLGWGWSLSFVSGSALLTQGLAYSDRARLQGATDSVVWTAAATAGLGSGVLVAAFSYGSLCVVGVLLIVAPVLTIASRRRALAAQPA